MGYSEFDPATQGRSAWNAGKAVGTKRPLTQKQIWAIRFFLDREGGLRDRALYHVPNLEVLAPQGAIDADYFGTVLGLSPLALRRQNSYFSGASGIKCWEPRTCSDLMAVLGESIVGDYAERVSAT